MLAVGQWVGATPVLVIGLLTFLGMVAAAYVGALARRHRERSRTREGKDAEENRDGYVVSAIPGVIGSPARLHVLACSGSL